MSPEFGVERGVVSPYFLTLFFQVLTGLKTVVWCLFLLQVIDSVMSSALRTQVMSVSNISITDRHTEKAQDHKIITGENITFGSFEVHAFIQEEIIKQNN